MPKANFDDLLRAEIRAEMGRQELTQQALADRLGWTLSTLHRRLKGHAPLSAEHLHQIAGALGVQVTDLGFPLTTRSGKGVR